MEQLRKLIRETVEQGVVGEILNKLEPTINKLMDRFEEESIKEFNKPLSEYDKKYFRIYVTFQLIQSIETYVQPTDKLIDLNWNITNKGNIEISAVINRDETDYRFVTELIYAGGYNIQRLHYRYITKTKLPKINQFNLTIKYKDKLKALDKNKKTVEMIRDYETRLIQLKNSVERNKTLTDFEILKLADTYGFYKMTWQDIVNQGAQANFNNSEEQFNSKHKIENQGMIDRWKRANIENTELFMTRMQNEIDRLKTKL